MRTAEDPHQQWADDGWGDDQRFCGGGCEHFVKCQFDIMEGLGYCRHKDKFVYEGDEC